MVRFMVVMPYTEILCQMFLTAVDHGIMHEIYHAGVAQKIPCYFRDWTKVPAMTYEQCYMVAWIKLRQIKHWMKVLKSNERGDSKEYVMHGSNIQGIVNMIKKEPKKFSDEIKLEKKEINHATIKVSWIKEPDYSHFIRQMYKKEKMVNMVTMVGLVVQVVVCSNL